MAVGVCPSPRHRIPDPVRIAGCAIHRYGIEQTVPVWPFLGTFRVAGWEQSERELPDEAAPIALDGLRREVQHLGDLLDRQPRVEQPQHLDLATGERSDRVRMHACLPYSICPSLV